MILIATNSTHVLLRSLVESADGDVVPDLAEVLRPARRVGEARVDAEKVHARLVVGAVVVLQALALNEDTS